MAEGLITREKALARAAARKRRAEDLAMQRQEAADDKGLMETAGEFGQQFNRGLAKMGALPLQAAGAVTGAPVPEDAAIRYYSDAIRGAGVPVADAPPKGLAGYMGEGTGEMASMVAPGSALTKPMMGLRGPVGKIARSAREFAKQRPKTAVSSDIGAGMGVGAGRKIADEKFPDNPTARLISEFAGGAAGALSPSAATASLRGTMGAAKRLPGVKILERTVSEALSPWSEQAAFTSIGTRLRAVARSKGEDPAQLANAIFKARQNSGPDLTAAQITGSPTLLALERDALAGDAALRGKLTQRTREHFEDMVSSVQKVGNSKSPRQFLKARVEQLNNALDLRLAEASESAAAKLAKLDPGAPAWKFSSAVKNSLEDVLIQAKATADSLWSGVDMTRPAKSLSARQEYRKLWNELGEYQKDDMPAVARLAFEGEGPLAQGKEAPLKDVYSLYGKLGEISTKAATEGNRNTARIATQLRGKLLKDIESAPSGGEDAANLALARQFSRKIFERFDEGEVGRLMGLKGKAEEAIPGELILDQSVTKPSIEGKLNLEAIKRAGSFEGKTPRTPAEVVAFGSGQPRSEITGGIQEFWKAKFTSPPELGGAVREGVVDPDAARKFLVKHNEVLSEFPDLHNQLLTAKTAEDATRKVRTGNEALRSMLDNPSVSSTAKILKAPVGREINALFSDSTTDPAVFAKRLVNAVNKDPSGEARRGLESATIDHILTRAMKPQGTAQGDIGFNGWEITRLLKDNRVGPAIEEILTPPEMARLKKLADHLQKVAVANSAQKEGVMSTKTLGERIASMAGLLFEARVTTPRFAQMGKAGGAGALKSAAVGNRFMREALETLSPDKVKRLRTSMVLGDSVKNSKFSKYPYNLEPDDLLQAMLLNQRAAPKNKLSRANKATETWLLTIGFDTLRDSEKAMMDERQKEIAKDYQRQKAR